VKENSIEETIKQLKLMLKVRKEQKEIIECAGGSCINCNPDIKALSESIDILSDYKRVLKENEELKEYKKIAELTKISCCTAQNCEALNNAIKSELENQKLKEKLNDINQKWIQKVKDKIEELQNCPLKINENNKYYYETKAYNKIIIQVLQELLEGRK
jgi:tRNA U34 5-carboxymethylaminomethyl modifying GTPase MnmE/TrmE